MKNMKKYIYSFVAISVCVYFIPTQSQSQIKYDIDISKFLKNEETVNLSDVAKTVEYIILETTPDCILDSDYKIEITSEYIFIFDYTNLYRFSNAGKFLNKIGKMGKGPGEYLRLGADFAVDDQNKEVFLLDFMGKKILVYQYDGSYLRDIKLDFSGQFMSLLDAKYIIHNNINYNRFSEREDTYELEILDSDGNKIKQLKSTLAKNLEYGMILYFPFFYQYDNKTLYKNPLNDTVYNLTNIRYEPYGIISTGRYSRDHKKNDFNRGRYTVDRSSIIVTEVKESTKYLFITYAFEGAVHRLLFDKNANKSTNIVTRIKNLIEERRESTYTKALTNDIDGGFPFWPRKIQNDSILVDIRYAYEFKLLDDNWFRNKSILNEDKRDNLKKLSKKVNESDNPILIIVR
jgi:hypothetical protein